MVSIKEVIINNLVFAWVNLMTTMPVMMEERIIPNMDWIVTEFENNSVYSRDIYYILN